MIAHLFQFIRKYHGQNIRLYSDLGICFPSSDIKSIKQNKSRTVMLLNFWGLLGVDSPLPLYFQELSKIEEGKAWIALLRIFENELYWHRYLLWKKTRPIYFIHKIKNSLLSTKQTNAYSAVYLLRILHQLFPNSLIDLQENVPSWKTIQLNQNIRLGYDTLLGQRILDVSSMIEIKVKTRDVNLAYRLLHASQQNHQLHMLIQRHLSSHQTYRCYVQLKLRQKHLLKLGGRVRLGFFSLIGEQPKRYYLPKMLSTHRIAGMWDFTAS